MIDVPLHSAHAFPSRKEQSILERVAYSATNNDRMKCGSATCWLVIVEPRPVAFAIWQHLPAWLWRVESANRRVLRFHLGFSSRLAFAGCVLVRFAERLEAILTANAWTAVYSRP